MDIKLRSSSGQGHPGRARWVRGGGVRDPEEGPKEALKRCWTLAVVNCAVVSPELPWAGYSGFAKRSQCSPKKITMDAAAPTIGFRVR